MHKLGSNLLVREEEKGERKEVDKVQMEVIAHSFHQRVQHNGVKETLTEVQAKFFIMGGGGGGKSWREILMPRKGNSSG